MAAASPRERLPILLAVSGVIAHGVAALLGWPYLVAKGIEALMVMQEMEAHTRKMLSEIDPDDLPAELRDALEERGAIEKTERTPASEDEDEFERLRKKYM